MHCENCGKKIEDSNNYCSSCGAKIQSKYSEEKNVSDEKFWFRLLKVAYIIMYIPLPFILWGVGYANYETWDYGVGYTSTPGKAFWYCLLTLVIYLSIVRLIKIAGLYITAGKKPIWTHEFKKIF